SLSSYTLPLKEVNNEILKAKELENIVENQPVNEKLKKASSAEYKYHPKTNEVLRELVSHESVKLSEIDISEVSDFSALFQDSTRSDFSGIEDWDVSHVTNMRNMFRGIENFNSDISSWDVSNVADMSFMFAGAKNFNSDISSWDVSNVTNMGYMFYGANSFNQSLDNWNVSNVKNMKNMFFSGADVGSVFPGFASFARAAGVSSAIGAGTKQQPPNKKRLPKWYKE
ncbi:BspA family leucine-rich repeat surface protein, partial [Campylobacter lanienae]|uniref:BspA family leucine-rich repeat surface protein n=1 Tax=Campylobacter lanienae TaxID=75658 RepID=UPI002A90DEFC